MRGRLAGGQIRFGTEPGWVGGFTRHQAAEAYPNGSRIVKLPGEAGDATAVGTYGTVLGSLPGDLVVVYNPNGLRLAYFYFVEWDDKPRCAVGVADWKIGLA